MIYSRTQILQKEVFFIDVIDNVPQEKLMHLKAIFFVRCTDENVQKICRQLQNPTFSSYNLCKFLVFIQQQLRYALVLFLNRESEIVFLVVDFSNTVPNVKIQEFAENDVHNVVNQVQEVFADF